MGAVEWALRAAMQNMSGTESTGDMASAFKDAATKQLNVLMPGDSAEKSVQLEILEGVLVGLVVGTTVAVMGGIHHWNYTKTKRSQLSQEVDAHGATYQVPKNISRKTLPRKHAFIMNYVDLLKKNGSLKAFSGLCEIKNQDFYDFSLMPFYLMNASADIPLASRRLIHRQRRTILTYLKSNIPKELSKIEKKYESESSPVSFFNSFSSVYLCDIRAARFLITCLANIMWSFCHPVDAKTGMPLSSKDNILLCRQFELFLNTILTSLEPQTGNEPSLLQNFNRNREQLVSCIRNLQVMTSALRAAYLEEQLSTFSMDDVITNAHQALDIMNNSILSLIYKRDMKVDGLLYKMNYMRDLFRLNPGLINSLTSYDTLNVEVTLVNTPPTTVMDALIIFFHMTTADRSTLISSKGTKSSEKEFFELLGQFNTEFILPVESINKKELDKKGHASGEIEVANLTACTLLPVITLIVASYETDIDTPQILKCASDENLILTGNQQIDYINRQAALNSNGRYRWTLAPFMTVSPETAINLDKLIAHQYRLTQVTLLLDNINQLLSSNVNLLQQQVTLDFLQRAIDKIKLDYKILEQIIQDLTTQLLEDEEMTHRLKGILLQMTLDIEKRFDDLKQATHDLKEVIDAPNFINRQKKLFADQIRVINQQYFQLYKENTGLDKLTLITSVEAPSMLSRPDVVSSCKVVALSQLVHKCYDNLSYLSRYGRKGAILHNLMQTIDNGRAFTQDGFERAIKELTRVVASYSETCFFQASYGQTRSAKILIQAIQDPKLNAQLALSTTIFGKSGTDYSKLSAIQLSDSLQILRQNPKVQWQESAQELTIVGRL